MPEIFSPVGCVADVLLVLDELPATATGEVVCTSDEGVRVGTVFVEKGRVCWAVAPGLARRLVDLLREGLVSGGTSVLEEAFRTCRSEGRPLGEHLVSSGIVSESDLRAALLRHSAESLVASCRERSRACFMPRGPRGYSPWFTFDTPTLLVEAGDVLVPSAARRARAVLASSLTDHGWAAAFARTGGAPTALALAGHHPTVASEVTSLGKWAASAVDMASAAAGAPSFVAASLSNGDTAACWMESEVLVAAVVPARWTGAVVARALRLRQGGAPCGSRSAS